LGKVGFTLKERAFISALLSHGFNKKQAYLSVCPDVDEHSADVLGSRIYQRIIKKKTAGNHCLTLLVLMISGLVMKLTNGLKLKRRNFTRAKRLPLLLTMALACAVPSFSQKSEVGENQKSICTITKKKPSQRYSKGNRKKMTLTLRPKQSKAFKSMGTEILYGGAAGGGKALALDTPIPTLSGWAMMGELNIGDMVFDECGKPCRVIALTDPMIDRPCYEVVFDNGEKIIADAEHSWAVYDDAARSALRRRTDEYRTQRREKRSSKSTGKRPDLAMANREREQTYLPEPKAEIVTTKTMASRVDCRGRTNYSIRVCGGLDLSALTLPIDPYVFGVWLGDGTRGQGAITSADIEVVQEIERRGYTVRKRSAKYAYGILGIQGKLKAIGCEYSKEIPQEYLRASTEQRMDLLRGLMDTDGTANKRGACEFDNCDRKLIGSVHELLVSLGIKATITEGRAKLYGKDCGQKYRLKYATAKKVFILPRKLKRIITDERGTQKWHMVKSITAIKSVPVRCIQADSPSNLFLAGRSMVPTHNSHLYRVASITWCNDIPGLQVYIFRRTHPELMDEHMTGPTSFRVMLSPWVRSGKVRIVDDSKIYFRPRKVRFPDTGEEKELISTIHLCHCQYLKNVYDYQSAEMHVLMVGEAGNWQNQMYTYLRGRVRLSGIVIPQRYEGLFPRIVLTANPGGIGHHWLKMGWVDKGPGLHQMPDSEGGMIREYIPALLDDNPDLLKYDPNYERRLQGLGNSALVRALRYGDWDIVAGGALDDVWDRTVHVIKPFKIPASWYVDRSFDWGSSKPFSVGWWAESDGTEIADPPSGVKKSYPRGTIFRVGEWYGWNGKPNEGTKTEDVDIGKGIAAKEKNLREYLGIRQRIQPGPADSSIFEADPGKLSIAQGIDSGYGQRGCFVPADKSPGSRKNGLSVLRRKLKASLAERLEEPGFFVFNTCNDGFIRTVPVLPRSERDMDDVDTQAEDHAYDETRYRIAAAKRIASRVSITFGGA
jgi:hypothetical protein